jgi:hypothetical protein
MDADWYRYQKCLRSWHRQGMPIVRRRRWRLIISLRICLCQMPSGIKSSSGPDWPSPTATSSTDSKSDLIHRRRQRLINPVCHCDSAKPFGREDLLSASKAFHHLPRPVLLRPPALSLIYERMSSAHDTLYPNAARTRSLVVYGEYFKYLDELARSLDGFKILWRQKK